jgi:hypothetical protein
VKLENLIQIILQMESSVLFNLLFEQLLIELNLVRDISYHDDQTRDTVDLNDGLLQDHCAAFQDLRTCTTGATVLYLLRAGLTNLFPLLYFHGIHNALFLEVLDHLVQGEYRLSQLGRLYTATVCSVLFLFLEPFCDPT